ncbi:MAG TPA: alpha/beta hydrolase [Stellaceae bacterium]|nr:alpha/beta hydrolase [Stellaceae bacterium]
MSAIPGFAERSVATPEAEIHVAIGGEGPPLLLLHGYPETHVCWHLVAPTLARSFTVVCPDLRGYGKSRFTGRESADHAAFSKRAMAADQVALMAALGHDRFAVAGHDRGARVAYRLALDHEARVERLALLDIVPTLETFERMTQASALSAYHWLFLAQPFDLPERLIGKDPDFYLDWTIASWCAPSARLAEAAMEDYRRAFRDPAVIHATCEDYRAGATLDCDYDRADREAGRRILCPLLVLWGAKRRVAAQAAALGPLDTWRRWAAIVEGGPLACGHFLPEEAPDEVAAALLGFMSR